MQKFQLTRVKPFQKGTGELQDVSEPNLFRDQFPYSEVPKIVFDGIDVPLEPAPEIFITDTTFRDGQQARVPYTPGQIAHLYELMHRLGGANGVIRRSEFFLYSDKDKKAVEMCLSKNKRFPEVTGWIRAVKNDISLVKQMGLKETGILTSCSDYHIFLKLKKTRREAMDGYLDVVRAAIDSGLRIRCHLEDMTRADIYGFVLPFVKTLMRIAEEAKTPIIIRVCDTMGYGVTYPQAALPRSVPKLFHVMRHEAGVPPEWMEWHGHNDFHKVHINAATAWLYGCSGANGTLLGFGERTGNPPIEGLIMEYIGLKGISDGIDTAVITEIAEYYTKELKTPPPACMPFVGKDFNVTRAGIHADGILKNEEIYNIFDTGKILNRPLDAGITDKSGLAGIAHWIRTHVEKAKNIPIDKRDPGIVKIHEWVTSEYETYRITAISDAEMSEQIRKHLPKLL